MGVNSEYKFLNAVLLFKPGGEVEGVGSPEEVLHVQRINYTALQKEYEELISSYRNLNVNTYFIDDGIMQLEDKRYLYNMMYTRDLFFMTPSGAIMANMAFDIRKQEVEFAVRALEDAAIPVIAQINGAGTFEGADAIWINDKLVMVGVGNRTNQDGFFQLKDRLENYGITCKPVPAPRDVIHLLGAVQIVDANLALVRSSLVAKEIIQLLKENGTNIIEIPENEETRDKHSMNIVTVAPKEVIMADNCPETKKIFQDSGIRIVAEIPSEQISNGRGGLACTTAVLSRELEDRLK